MPVRDLKFIEKHMPECLEVVETSIFIAFAGRRRTGKSTVAQIIKDYDSRYRILSFAGTLKDMFATERGIPREELDDGRAKERYREDLQTFSESYLAADPFHFVRALFLKVKPGERIIIDDLRYIHELWSLYAAGAQIHIIHAEKHIKRARGWVYNQITDNHLSETELGDLCSHTLHSLGGTCIYNNGNLDNLKEQALKIIQKNLVLL